MTKKFDKGNSINDRIDLIIGKFYKGNNSTFARIIGTSESNVRGYIDNVMPKQDLLEKIARKTDVNSDWLLTGRGSMLNVPDSSEQKTNVEEAPRAYHTNKLGEGIPLLPCSAMAGALTMEQTVLDYECEHYVVPVFKGADFLIPVKGSSMYPKYSSGDIVACQRVPLQDLFFQWNKVYVLDTIQGPLIKRVKKGTDKEHVLLVSDNASYDPFELPISGLNAVAIVIGVIRLE